MLKLRLWDAMTVDETDLVVDLQALARKKRKTMKNKKPPKK